uniref:peptidylprolyl isomerase n=1 Tax=Bigelowiella natans TaxID=227086 RepID=A0A6T7ESG3_BIGNA
MAKAESLKKEGNAFFKKKEYAEALKRYVRIFLYINHLNVSDDLKQMVGNRAPETGSVKSEDVVKLQVVVNQNCALCKLNLGDYAYSETFCNKALTRDPKAMKAIMIRGRARLRLNNLDGAKQDLEAAKKEFPNSKVIQADLEHLKRKYKKVEQKQAKLFAGMFDRKPKKQRAKTDSVKGLVSEAIGGEEGDKISSLISQFTGGADSSSSTADQPSSS